MLAQENTETRLLFKSSPLRMRLTVLSFDLSAPVALNVFSGDNNSQFLVSTECVYGVLGGTKFENFEVVFGVDHRR